jgi:EAL domain-containing protein (putative c-di-GMP-specific phosphodiesterase class I)
MVDPEKELSQEPAPRPAVLPRWGDVLAPVIQRFQALPVLGAVVIDAADLQRLEVEAGREALASSLANLGSLVREVTSTLLGPDALVVSGAMGRPEIRVLAFRDEGDPTFFRQDLPNLVRALVSAIERKGHRIVYPWSRRVPVVGVGYACTSRNPYYEEETQLRRLLEEAAEAADLQRRTTLQRRRHGLQSILFGGRVSSVYEPIVDVATKTVYAYEALARGPEGTPFHFPVALFQAAEDEGLIYELDCLCRTSGLDGAVELPDDTQLFLNVRPTTIHDPKFRPDAVIRTLEASRLRPANVVFEISEQESIENFDAFREIRDEYRSLGFRFALDDTGSGYASLQAVIELEPDFIKVDRALITGLDTNRSKQTLLRALQDVADGIGARIIGEGLDTLEELEMLGELQIPFGQGWLFGKPTPLLTGEGLRQRTR